jgi:two-component system sensor histidine kinase TctE
MRYTPENGAVTVALPANPRRGLADGGRQRPRHPAGRREAVFSRFVRLDDKTTGSGLGLAIVRDIAHAHGATVSIDEPGERAGRPVFRAVPRRNFVLSGFCQGFLREMQAWAARLAS